MQSVIQQYNKVAITTASPLENIILLYQKCLTHLAQAEKIIEKKDRSYRDISRKGELITKTMDILNELDASLDMEQGEVAASLHHSYQAILTNVGEANIKNDPARLRFAIELLQQLRDAWIEIKHMEKEQKGS